MVKKVTGNMGTISRGYANIESLERKRIKIYIKSKEIKISRLNLTSKLSPIIFLENKNRLIITDKVKKIRAAAIWLKSMYLPSPA